MSYYTEEQAKTKWCPMATASHTDPRAGFGDDGRPIIFPCIGAQCMAWRLEDRAGHEMTLMNDDADVLLQRFPGRYEVLEKIEDAGCKVIRVVADFGYCGAFGKPS